MIHITFHAILLPQEYCAPAFLPLAERYLLQKRLSRTCPFDSLNDLDASFVPAQMWHVRMVT